MTVRRSTVAVPRVPAADRAAPFLIGLAASALMASAIAARVAHAAPIERTLFTWTGRVDREVYLVIRGRDVQTRGQDAELPNRARVSDPLPRAIGAVIVQMRDGRGTVDVIEQPSVRNGYQATIRIRDPRAGADNYRLTAYWQGDDRYDDRNIDRNGDRGDNRNGSGWGWGRGGRDDDRNNDSRDRDRDDRNRGNDDRNGRTNDRGVDAGSLRWSGRVDDVVEVRISGRRVETITRSGVTVQDVSANVRGGALPLRPVNLILDQSSGRGRVELVQQPSPWNGYTAVIRINDSRSGAAFYDFTVSW